MDFGVWRAADPELLFWSVAFLHLLGLASVLLARLPRSQRGLALCHSGYLACLVIVAVATLMTIVARSEWWVWSGTVFSVMAVAGTADLRQLAPAAGAEL
jgi:hypothetical protein